MSRRRPVLVLASLLTMATVTMLMVVPAPLAQASSTASKAFSSRAYLADFVVGSKPEAAPDTAPETFGWAKASTSNFQTEAAPAGTPDISLWGQIYTTNDTHAANVRVEIDDCQTWGLLKSTDSWGTGPIIDNSSVNTLSATGWNQDWTSSKGPLDMTTKYGAESFATTANWIAHFWPTNAAKPANIVPLGSAYKAVVTACSTRLVSTGSPNNTSRSTYLLSVGSDFKTNAKGGCPADGQVVNGVAQEKCKSVGVGRFILVKTYWRRAVMTTMTSSQLASFPALPIAALKNPGRELRLRRLMELSIPHLSGSGRPRAAPLRSS